MGLELLGDISVLISFSNYTVCSIVKLKNTGSKFRLFGGVWVGLKIGFGGRTWVWVSSKFNLSSSKQFEVHYIWVQSNTNMYNNLDYSTGVGYATMTIVFFLDIYYCIIIAWTLFYLLATLISIPELPWGTCGKQKMLWYNELTMCDFHDFGLTWKCQKMCFGWLHDYLKD